MEEKETFVKGDNVIPNIKELKWYTPEANIMLFRQLFQTRDIEKLFKVQWSDDNITKLYGVKEPVENKYIKKFEVKYLDAAGRSLNIGDQVLYIKPSHRELVKGYIIRLGPKQASVGDTPNDTYTIGRDYNYIAKI